MCNLPGMVGHPRVHTTTDNQPICMPGNSNITVLGKLSKLVMKGLYMVELVVHNNLLYGVVVNCGYVTPKTGQVAVILINDTNKNTQIWQPLLANKMYEVEMHPWQYHSM